MQAFLHIIMTNYALGSGKHRLGKPLLKIASGAASRADIHHFPQQHFTVDMQAGVDFVKKTKNYIQKEVKKFSKMVELEKRISGLDDERKKARYLARLNKLKEKEAVKIAYSLGRISHTIQDARSHVVDPQWKLTLGMITGKRPMYPGLYTSRFGLPTELASKALNLLHRPNPEQFSPVKKNLQNIYESYAAVPGEKFSVLNPKTWLTTLRRSHGFVHLDYPGSLRDRATIAATGESAFEKAIRKATKDTKKFWKKHILTPVEKELGEEKMKNIISGLQSMELGPNIFKGNQWEKIGEKAFDSEVVSKLPKIKEDGPVSSFLFAVTKPFIPYEHKRKPAAERFKSKIKKILQQNKTKKTA